VSVQLPKLPTQRDSLHMRCHVSCVRLQRTSSRSSYLSTTDPGHASTSAQPAAVWCVQTAHKLRYPYTTVVKRRPASFVDMGLVSVLWSNNVASVERFFRGEAAVLIRSCINSFSPVYWHCFPKIKIVRFILTCLPNSYATSRDKDGNKQSINLTWIQPTCRTAPIITCCHPSSTIFFFIIFIIFIIIFIVQITNRSLGCASPFLWNQLPSSFRQPHCVHSPPGSPHLPHISHHNDLCLHSYHLLFLSSFKSSNF